MITVVIPLFTTWPPSLVREHRGACREPRRRPEFDTWFLPSVCRVCNIVKSKTAQSSRPKSVAIYYRQGSLTYRNVFFHSPGGWESEIRGQCVRLSVLVDGRLLTAASHGFSSVGVCRQTDGDGLRALRCPFLRGYWHCQTRARTQDLV